MEAGQDLSREKVVNNEAKLTDRTALLGRSDSRPDSVPLNEVVERWVRPCLVEFLGMALFVFMGTTAACSGGTLEGVALAHGLTITLLVIATGSISGAHFNPAVTLGVLLGGSITPTLALFYLFSQLLGAILGSAFTLGVVGRSVFDHNGGGAHTLPNLIEPSSAVLCEILLTSLLVIVVLVAAVDPVTQNPLAPLAIGFTVVVDILAGGGISGASMNPARSFGPSVVAQVWGYHWIYWLGPLIGGVAAGIIYRLILASPEKRVYNLMRLRF